MTHLLILGGGGHGAVVIDAARAAGVAVAGVLDDADVQRELIALDCPQLGAIDDLDDVAAALGPDWAAHAATGDPDRRRAWLERVERTRRVTIIHPSAVIASSARVASGVFIGPRAVVNARACVEQGAIINTGAIVEHDCRIGAFAHLAPAAVLAGGCEVGEAALVGTAATAGPGVTIGERATLGAGGVAMSDIPDGVCAVGVPARVMEVGRGQRTRRC